MPDYPQVSLVLIELTPGTVSVAMRVAHSRSIQVFNGWRDIEPEKAVSILVSIRKGEITPDDLAVRGFKNVELSEELLQKMEGK